ncbi:MAG: DUF2298 domain-containing protein, partial [Candidatus Binatia bacterium]
RRSWSPRAPLRSALPAVGVVVAAAAAVVVLALPFVRHFAAPLGGIGWVHAHTSARDAFVVFGILAAPIALAIAGRVLDSTAPSEARGVVFSASLFAAAVIAIFAKSTVLACALLLLAASLFVFLNDRRPAAGAAALVALAAVAVGLCEVVYLRDSYGTDLHRMNTVFKFYFQAWIYAALAWPAMLAIAGERLEPGMPRTAGAVALAILVVAGLAYPVAALATFGRTAPRPLTLDGMAYLDREHPDDARAIRWLRDHASGRPRVLEATGDAYSYFARVSSNTGFPTPLGWANHEGVWRGGEPRISRRASLVREIYETPVADEALAELRRLDVRFVFVGELERSRHAGDGIRKFAENPTAFAEVFRSGQTAVYELPPR